MAGGDAAGLLILGPSGAGKSGLALELMALGARLVADDRTEVRATRHGLVASAQPGLPALVEARGMGLLPVTLLAECTLRVAVDLAHTETARMPPPRHLPLLGLRLPLFHAVAIRSFPAALLQYLRNSQDTGAPA
jgi:HPr kinase/phosphorylase